MTRLPSLIAAALCALPLTHAWTLKWENHTNGGLLNLGEKPKGCTRIYHEEGEQFSWDPEGLFCLRFFIDSKCETPGGETCNGKPWKKNASKDLAAFSVRDMPDSSMSYYGLTSATPFPTTDKKPEATPTTDDQKKDDSKDSSKDDSNSSSSNAGLSSGGIAGIVVGIVAGVGILAGLIFFLWRRGRGAKATPIPETPTDPRPSSPGGASTNPDQSTFAASAAGAYGTSEKGDVSELHSPHEHSQGPAPPSYQPVVLAELSAGDVQAELSNEHQVVEMDAQSEKRPVYRDT